MGMPEGESGPPIEPGTVIAEKYRIVRYLGGGGMGEVYVADQLEMERRVALKLVRSYLAGDGAILDRFRREAKAASRIRNRHVVTVYDFGRDTGETGRLYLAMELLEGETLAARLERTGPIAVHEAIALASQVCVALESAHAAGVIHRDLKPENVFVEPDGHAKVLDFGIARIVDPGDAGPSQATMMATFIGTPAYASPEAAQRQKQRQIGPAADLYSLGVMLFEMITGRLPFDDPEPMILIGLHLRAPPERLSDVVGGGAVPDSLDELVDSMLAKEPEQRPPSARAVLDALRACATELGAEPTRIESMPEPSPVVTGDVPVSVVTGPVAVPVRLTPPLQVEGTQHRRTGVAVVVGLAVTAIAALMVTAVATFAFGAWPPAAQTSEITGSSAMPPVTSVGGDPSAPTVPPTTAPVPPETGAPPGRVTITFVPSPGRARIELDGHRIDGSSVVLPADGASHRAVAVDGRRRSTPVEFTADEDRTVELAVRGAHGAGRGTRLAPAISPAPSDPQPVPNMRGSRPGLLGLIQDE